MLETLGQELHSSDMQVLQETGLPIHPLHLGSLDHLQSRARPVIDCPTNVCAWSAILHNSRLMAEIGQLLRFLSLKSVGLSQRGYCDHGHVDSAFTIKSCFAHLRRSWRCLQSCLTLQTKELRSSLDGSLLLQERFEFRHLCLQSHIRPHHLRYLDRLFSLTQIVWHCQGQYFRTETLD